MRQVFHWVVIFVFPASSAMNILIFGGNGFIGSHVSERLLDEGHRLTLVSRTGSFQWDTISTVQPRIMRHYRCDRYNPAMCDEELWRQIDESPSNYDAIIDFSAYRLEAVQPFYGRLAKSSNGANGPLYIYISTDSVYEVCTMPEETRPLKETDAVRPVNEKERLELAKRDSYGDRKLGIEEFLIDQRKNHAGLPYTILRLPDVLGERDSTNRWGKYQLWLRYGTVIQRPVQVPTYTHSLRTSYVDVKDVAAMIAAILNQRSKSEDQIYNVAFEKSFTLMELLTEIQLACDAPNGSIAPASKNDDENSLSYFPSVTRGAIDATKAQAELGWRPLMQWQDAVRRIASFYLDGETNYEKEMMEFGRGLMHDLEVDDKERKPFFDALRERSLSQSKAKKKRPNDEF